MNEELFCDHLKELFKILDSSGLDHREVQLRKSRLQQSFDLIYKEESRKSYDLYYQRAHEVESIQLLKNYGCIDIAEDFRNSRGCDIVLNDHIYVECVCASYGDMTKNGLDKFAGEGVFDYNELSAIINTRFTSSLWDKVKFFKKRVGSSIPSERPYVIFLSVGGLIEKWFKGKYGRELLQILWGKGHLTITINTTTGKAVDSGYTYRDYFEKFNGVQIGCNL
ncbi:MAG: hypothetical protein AAGU32_07905, partial [Bacillota bacterium]